MGLESATYISGLVASNPTSSDFKTQGDDHIRLIKSTLLASFPNITGAVTPTQSELLHVFTVPVYSTSGGTAAPVVRGKCYSTTGDIGIEINIFAAGDIFSIYNNSASNINIAQGISFTLRLAGTTSVGTRVLAPRGMATVWYLSATEAIVTGAGVS